MTTQVQAMPFYSTLGALHTDAGGANSSTATRNHSHLVFPGNAAGHVCDILRCHGHFSHTLFADREAQPWQLCTGTGFASFLIIEMSDLGFRFKTILLSNSGGACREVDSR